MAATDDFDPLIRDWFNARYSRPTDAQEKTWPLVRKGAHVLVSAPTGSGKTLTAFLTALDHFVRGDWDPDRMGVLYVSPLKALNNDVQKNLLVPLEEIRALAASQNRPISEIRVGIRSGDTPEAERRALLRRPPSIFITTPETLNLMLSSPTTRRVFADLKLVVLDEVHAVAGTKRGVHLITAVERLTLQAGEFQRLGLSATVSPLETAAEWLGGPKRRVEIVAAADRRVLDLRVSSIEFVPSEDEDLWWQALVRELKVIIEAHRSTLIFTNSRRMTEKIARLLNEGEDEVLAWSHHGSLSRELRLEVENKLKDGELRALVATNSLELGIDIGALDRVILVETPFSVGSALQRVGRAGHQVGAVSRADLFPLHPQGLISAAVVAALARKGDIEPLVVPQGALDVLAQVVLSMTIRTPWRDDDLYSFLTSTSPYEKLSRGRFDLTVEMLAGRWSKAPIRSLKPRLNYDRTSGLLEAREGAAFLLYQGGGTIPDRGSYRLRLSDSKTLLGELDEEFVHERRLGDQFAFGTQNWRILKITDQDVEVAPAGNRGAMIPFWKAESQSQPFYLAERIGEALETWNSRADDPNFVSYLAEGWGLEPRAARHLAEFIRSVTGALGCALPHRRHVVVEEIRAEQNRETHRPVAVHTFWGGRVNRTWALAVESEWRRRFGQSLAWYADNACVLFLVPLEQGDPAQVAGLVAPETLEIRLAEILPTTGTFGARFREAAGRALLLPKGAQRRVPLWLTRQRSKDLLETLLPYPDFPLVLEAWRECLETELDVPNLKTLLEELVSGEIRTTTVVTTKPSPLVDGVVWKQTNDLIYADDKPATAPAHNPDLLKELLGRTDLRPALPSTLIQKSEDRLLGLDPDWGPETRAEALEKLSDLGWVEKRVWEAWTLVLKEEKFAASDVEIVRLPGAGTDLVARPSEALDLRDALEKGRTDAVLGRWLANHGPVATTRLNEVFGWDGETLTAAIETLEADGFVVLGKLIEGVDEPTVCDARNYELLLRRLRRARRESRPPRPLDDLALFLADWQGLTAPGSTAADLQGVLDRLFGLALPAALWENAVLPARLSPYQPAWLDQLFHNYGLTWFGAGEKKTGFCFREDLGRLLSEPDDEVAALFPEGRDQGLLELTQRTAQTAGELTRKLWALAWRGKLACDSFETLRRGLSGGFEPEIPTRPSARGGFRRWEHSRAVVGRWIPRPTTQEKDEVALEEERRDRARQALQRYGVVFRELLQNEKAGFRWKDLVRTFRALEWSGEIAAGAFFEGVAGIQFASSEAAARWGETLPEDKIWWMNAQDPASLCGVGLSGVLESLPRRTAANWLVYRGNRLAAKVLRSGADAEISLSPDDPALKPALAFYHRLMDRPEASPSLVVETVDGRPAGESPYAEAFVACGFQRDYRGLRLWRK